MLIKKTQYLTGDKEFDKKLRKLWVNIETLFIELDIIGADLDKLEVNIKESEI